MTRHILYTTLAGIFLLGMLLTGAKPGSGKTEPACGPIAELPELAVRVILRWYNADEVKHMLYEDKEHNVYIISWPSEDTACLILRGANLQFNDSLLQQRGAPDGRT